ncbi:MAG: L-threonylcarbamoyladenylate synthase [Acidimicrobiales bacterium]
MTRIVERDEAVQMLLDGVVVAVPTDTVYGVAASLAHRETVVSLFLLKDRPSTMPLPVLTHALNPIQEIDVEWGDMAQRLAEEFWPGALTIVVPASPELAALVGGSTDTVAVRVPDDELLLSVLRECGPLAVTSANSHGAPPCHSAQEVLRSLAGEHLAAVLDGGERRGEVSSVIQVGDASWRVVREGAVSAARIASVLD